MSRSRRDTLITFTLIALCIALRIATLSTYPIPHPSVIDEFANILGAETFRLGRLTNPTPLFPDSLFENNLLQSPTRMMIAQPAKALFMLLGKVLFGDHYWGIVLSAALMVGACYWAMIGWTTRHAAFACALCMLLLFRAPHYWMQSYWGATHIALAAWILIGCYPRILYCKQIGLMWLVMFSAILGAWSRPYESLILCICLAGAASIHIYFHYSRDEKFYFFRNTWLPIFVMGGFFIAAQVIYNKAITDSYITLPQTAALQQLEISPLFWIQKENPGTYSSHYAKHSMQLFNHQLYASALHQLPLRYILNLAYLLQLERLPAWLLPPLFVVVAIIVFVLPFLFLWRSYQKRHLRMLSTTAIALWFAFGALSWQLPHYMAVFFVIMSALITILITEYLAENSLRYHYRIAICLSALIYFSLDGSTYGDGYHDFYTERDHVIKELATIPGRHLILVDQKDEAQTTTLHRPWVFNEPDIDTSKIIWAWYLSPEKNHEIISHYRDRRIWYIKPGDNNGLIPFHQKTESKNK